MRTGEISMVCIPLKIVEMLSILVRQASWRTLYPGSHQDRTTLQGERVRVPVLEDVALLLALYK